MWKSRAGILCRQNIRATTLFNPFKPKSALIDFTLSNARRFYSSKGDPLGVKGLIFFLNLPKQLKSF